jgi:DNA-binding NtrC family response regulator
MDKLLSGRRVLVVEDEMLILLMTEGMLADLGCESLTTAATVDQALALIDAYIFDVAILDMDLKGNKSHAVADALAARGVPFVFATGHSGVMRIADRNRPVLKKPFQYEKLVEILARLLTHAPSDNIASDDSATGRSSENT